MNQFYSKPVPGGARLVKQLSGDERLKILANHLEVLEPETKDFKFDIGRWYRKVGDCATVACAAGYAALIPELQEQGFNLDHSTGSSCYDAVPVYNGYNLYGPFYNISKFFEISMRDAENIFSQQGYERECEVTPQMVSKKINKFLFRPRWWRALVNQILDELNF